MELQELKAKAFELIKALEIGKANLEVILKKLEVILKKIDELEKAPKIEEVKVAPV